MKKNFFKNIITFVFIALSVFAVICLAGCAPKAMKEVPFNLSSEYKKEYYPSKATLIKSVEEFESYLSNREIFTDIQSEEFIKENEKYDEEYFKKNDLIALIMQATSICVTGYEFKGLRKDYGGVWRLKVWDITPSKNVLLAMGRCFCYYLTVKKDAKMTSVELVW